jgi:hypothetical protein
MQHFGGNDTESAQDNRIAYSLDKPGLRLDVVLHDLRVIRPGVVRETRVVSRAHLLRVRRLQTELTGKRAEVKAAPGESAEEAAEQALALSGLRLIERVLGGLMELIVRKFPEVFGRT